MPKWVANHTDAGITAGVTSEWAMQMTDSDAVAEDLALMDAISIPLALIVLGLRVSNPTLMLLPVRPLGRIPTAGCQLALSRVL